MPIIKFTARGIAAIKPPRTGQVDYWDTTLPGFILRASYGGKKVWCLSYRHEGRKRRLTLGAYPALSLADARQLVGDALRDVAHGRDPAAEKKAKREAGTFGELAEEYLERYAKPRKKSWRIDARAFERDLLPRFQHRKADSITRKEVVRLLDEIVARGAPIQANRVLEIMRKAYNWAINRGALEFNPCSGIERPSKEHQRDRVLTDDEIRSVWAAFDAEARRVAAVFKLRLLTAQRGHEVVTMRREDVDRTAAWWTIPGEWTKNGLAHRVPLSPQALAILDELMDDGDEEWIFPSPRKGGPLGSLWRFSIRIRANSGVDFVPHDLRRTAASKMTGDLGIMRLTVSKILNHVETGVTAVYDRHSYDPEKRQALDAWGARLEQIVAGESAKLGGKVVPLHHG